MTDTATPTCSAYTREAITIVYDGECPFCQQYTQLLRLRASSGNVNLVNARDNDQIVSEVAARGFDLDQGMIVIVERRFYHGADAMHVLAMLSTQTGWFNRLNYHAFRSKRVSALLYPILRAGRNFVLRLLGRKPIKSS